MYLKLTTTLLKRLQIYDIETEVQFLLWDVYLKHRTPSTKHL